MSNKLGIKNINEVKTNSFVVFCSNCMNYFYEEITDERNDNALQQYFNEIENEYILCCPKCRTDNFLMNYGYTK